ncbi:MAG: GtrA family protein [Candidatus Woesearchaeota archaeon]
MLHHIKSHQKGFIRFCLVGIISTTCNYTLFLILLFSGVHYIIASSLGYISGIIISYFINKSFTFNVTQKTTIHHLAKYYAVFILSLIFGLGLIHVQVSYFLIHPAIAYAVVLAITTVTNYLGTHYLVFAKHKL